MLRVCARAPACNRNRLYNMCLTECAEQNPMDLSWSTAAAVCERNETKKKNNKKHVKNIVFGNIYGRTMSRVSGG